MKNQVGLFIVLVAIAGLLIFFSWRMDQQSLNTAELEDIEYSEDYDYNPYVLGEEPEATTVALESPAVEEPARRAPRAARIYKAHEVDRPPVFTVECLNSQPTGDCTNKAIRRYFNTQVEYPEGAALNAQEGYEYVTFVIDENGNITDKFRVVSENEECEGCAEAAVQAVANMPRWIPALKNGKPVKVELTLPVRFEVL